MCSGAASTDVEPRTTEILRNRNLSREVRVGLDGLQHLLLAIQRILG